MISRPGSWKSSRYCGIIYIDRKALIDKESFSPTAGGIITGSFLQDSGPFRASIYAYGSFNFPGYGEDFA